MRHPCESLSGSMSGNATFSMLFKRSLDGDLVPALDNPNMETIEEVVMVDVSRHLRRVTLRVVRKEDNDFDGVKSLSDTILDDVVRFSARVPGFHVDSKEFSDGLGDLMRIVNDQAERAGVKSSECNRQVRIDALLNFLTDEDDKITVHEWLFAHPEWDVKTEERLWGSLAVPNKDGVFSARPVENLSAERYRYLSGELGERKFLALLGDCPLLRPQFGAFTKTQSSALADAVLWRLTKEHGWEDGIDRCEQILFMVLENVFGRRRFDEDQFLAWLNSKSRFTPRSRLRNRDPSIHAAKHFSALLSQACRMERCRGDGETGAKFEGNGRLNLVRNLVRNLSRVFTVFFPRNR